MMFCLISLHYKFSILINFVCVCVCGVCVCVCQVFAVFGVTLFSAAVPSAFGDLSGALYTLFICITQDGWMAIYREF